jgi:aminomethyltransferase
MIAFAGWEMPLEYAGISEEHLAVRTRAGLFDVSHMGQIEIAGKAALAAVQWITCNDASRLENGQAQYSGLMTPAGTFVDDLLVYRLAAEHFLLVVNAANTSADYAWIVEHIRQCGDVTALDTSSRYALLALQGPLASQVMQRLTNFDLSGMRYYGFAHGEVAGVRATLSRTGYTGEDGFEIFVPPRQAPVVWNAILQSGKDEGVCPAGLGARDTLRLEAAMRLYGNDIDAGTTVLEAGLGWMIGWAKEAFVGRDALQGQQASGVARILVGFEMADGAIARHGYPVMIDGRKAGAVTSGTRTPFLKKAIGMAYVPAAHAAEGVEFDVEIRGRLHGARVVPLPFYQRPKG